MMGPAEYDRAMHTMWYSQRYFSFGGPYVPGF